MWQRKKRYANLDQIENNKSMKELLRWRQERRSKVKDLSYQVPVVSEPELSFLQANRSKTSITWVGHSTFLIQIAGCNILTDPVWARQMGMEKRLSPPGLRIEDLPPIDVILLSHGHFDHLHFPSLRQLKGGIRYLIPEGLGSLFRKKSFAHVQEFRWWEQLSIDEVCFHFVPAQHWSRRTLFDLNMSHWGGWVIQSKEECIYFAGDSGYFRGFKEIGQRFTIDYALMPIGAYEPEWFMGTSHLNPEEAVQAFVDMQAAHFIPMHYGAFRLADDTPQEALEQTLAAWKSIHMDTNNLHILKVGETLQVDGFINLNPDLANTTSFSLGNGNC